MSGNTIGKAVHGDDLRRKPWSGAGLHRGWLPAGPRAQRNPICSVTSTAGAAGTSHFVSQRRETDAGEASCPASTLGKTTGTPIGLLVENTDARSRDYDKLADRFRPGHADYTYAHKYGHRDHRGGGRSSARETVMRVAAGAIARKYLGRALAGAHQRLCEPDRGPAARAAAAREPPTRIRFSVLIRRCVPELEKLLWDLRSAGDSVGARVTVRAEGLSRQDLASPCSTGSMRTLRTR